MADCREINPDSSRILLVQYTAIEESRAVFELMGEPGFDLQHWQCGTKAHIQVVDKKLGIDVKFLSEKNDSLSADVLHDEEPTRRFWFFLIKYLG